MKSKIIGIVLLVISLGSMVPLDKVQPYIGSLISVVSNTDLKIEEPAPEYRNLGVKFDYITDKRDRVKFAIFLKNFCEDIPDLTGQGFNDYFVDSAKGFLGTSFKKYPISSSLIEVSGLKNDTPITAEQKEKLRAKLMAVAWYLSK